MNCTKVSSPLKPHGFNYVICNHVTLAYVSRHNPAPRFLKMPCGLFTLVFATESWTTNCTRSFSRITRPIQCRSYMSTASASQRRWNEQAARSFLHRSRESHALPILCNSVTQRERWRGLHSSPVSRHEQIVPPAPGTGIKVHFRDSKGQPLKTIEASEGDNILDLAHEYDIDLEGACEGSVACSTCHVILPPEHYDLLPEPEDDENDMLDMAFGLTDTSRLGCQVKLTRELDGMVVTLPSATRNMFVDGVKPTKH